MTAEPPKEAWDRAYAKRDRRHDTQDEAELARIEYYEALQELLLDESGQRRPRGVRRKVEERLGVDYSTLRWVEKVDTAELRRQLEQSKAEHERARREGDAAAAG